MFYELAKRVLRKNRCIARKMRSDLSPKELMMRLDAANLTFEECCLFVRVAEDAALLRYVMEQFRMQVTQAKEISSGKSLH